MPNASTDRSEFDAFLGAVRSAVVELPYRQRRIMTLRYGLDGTPHSLEEIGRVFAISRERVRQIQEQMLRRLLAADTPAASATRDLACSLAEDDKQLWAQLDEFPRLSDCKLAHELVLRLAGVPRDIAKRRVAAQLTAIKVQLTDRDPRQTHGGFQTFFDQTLWPRAVRPAPDLQGPVRRVGSTWDSGSFYSDKLGRDVTFESRLELYLLRQLEISRDVVSYVEQPIDLPYRFDGAPRLYVPDVLATLADARSVLIELKPSLHFGELRNLVKWAAAARWCGQHGLGLLVGDGQRAAWPVLTARVDTALRARVLAALDSEGILNWTQYQHVAGPGVPVDALAALAAAEPLDWRLRPFQLSRPDDDDAAEALALQRHLHARVG